MGDTRKIREYGIREKLELVENLTKYFSHATTLNKMKEFEEGIISVNLFSDVNIICHEAGFYFNVVSGRYYPFLVSEAKELLGGLLKDDDNVFINRYQVVVQNDKVLYINSYSGFFKETIIYKPLLLNFSAKHTIKNSEKRKVIEVLSKLENESNFIEMFQNSELTENDYKLIYDNIGVRAIKDALNLNLKQTEIDVDVLKGHLRTWKDAIEFLLKVVEKSQDSYNNVKGLVEISKEVTKQLLDKYEITSLF